MVLMILNSIKIEDLQDLQILMPLLSPSLALFLNQALKHFFQVLKTPEYLNLEAWAYLDCGIYGLKDN